MNISNNITAPCLLIAAMIILILFQSVFFTNADVIYTDPDFDFDFDTQTGINNINESDQLEKISAPFLFSFCFFISQPRLFP